MGCGCAGSTPRTVQERNAQAPSPQVGPGSPGYTWNGPQRRSETKPAAKPEK